MKRIIRVNKKGVVIWSESRPKEVVRNDMPGLLLEVGPLKPVEQPEEFIKIAEKQDIVTWPDRKKDHDLTIANATLATIEFRGFRYKFQQHITQGYFPQDWLGIRGRGVWLHVLTHVLERDTGQEIQLQHTDRLDITKLNDPQYIRDAAWKNVMNLLEHELSECYYVEGKRVRDPHIKQYTEIKTL